MSQFTRSTYDQANTNSQHVQSTKASYLTFNTLQEHPNACHSANGPRNNRPNASSELGVNRIIAVNIESMLKGIGPGSELSRNIDINSFLKNETKLVNEYDNISKKIPESCSTLLDTSYTRLNPNEKLQEKSWNRYEYQIDNSTSRVYNGIQGFTQGNNRQGLSTRIDVHDQLEKKNKVMRKLAGKITTPLATL